MRDHTQRVIVKDLSKYNKAYLVPIADLHEGSRDADHEISDGYINWVAQNANAYTVLNGDLMNCAWKESTPDLFEDLVTPDMAYERLRARLMPIKDKIIMITRGGHEESIFRKVGADYMARLAYDLGDIPYMPDGGMFGIRLSKNKHTVMFWGYATHGWGGARTIGAKIKKVEDLANIANVDMIILSHDHTQAIHRLNVLEPPRSKLSFTRPMYLTIQRKLLINTGGFVRYEGYIQRKGYAPQDLGTPRIRLEIKQGKELGYHKDLHASI
jgi:hypothetical protein